MDMMLGMCSVFFADRMILRFRLESYSYFFVCFFLGFGLRSRALFFGTLCWLLIVRFSILYTLVFAVAFPAAARVNLTPLNHPQSAMPFFLIFVA